LPWAEAFVMPKSLNVPFAACFPIAGTGRKRRRSVKI
jgi:hypothetical protein